MSEIKTNNITAEIGLQPFTTTITAGSHTLYTDEPVEEGGSGQGPKCHDLLLGSLASCICITLKMYSGRKNWKLDGVHINAMMNRTWESGNQNTTVHLRISLKGELDADQRSRLIFIASKCPVHKTLAPAMDISIEQV